VGVSNPCFVGLDAGEVGLRDEPCASGQRRINIRGFEEEKRAQGASDDPRLWTVPTQ
jgi:hypothetical protein